MELQISNQTISQLKESSQKFGISEKEIVEKALILYLGYLRNSKSLQEEIGEWESAGIEDLNNFE